MFKDPSKALTDILVARIHQKEKFSAGHDAENNTGDWVNIIDIHLQDACGSAEVDDGPMFRDFMVRTAAVALAAVEAYDAKGSL